LASFAEHIEHAKKNIRLLNLVNNSHNSFWDWQTTVSYYISVHLVNAHLAQCADLHYRSHEDVRHAINPFNSLATCKLPETAYLAYMNLQLLSRRSRYLVSDKTENMTTEACFTSDKHFAKAVRHLDTLMSFMKSKYPDIEFEINTIDCDRIKGDSLSYYKHNKAA